MILFNCPHCNEPYKLKDEYAGKKATCKGAACRKVITIPPPGTATLKPGDTPPPVPPIDVEAAALSALEDSPAEKAGPQAIPMTCEFCGHKWTEPVAKAGKNVLCQNPECRQRMKVPVPKEHTPADWRTAGRDGPSMRKENFDKPTDVQDAGDAKVVSRDALKHADATNEEIEPRPLKQKVLFVLVPLLILSAMGVGIWYLWGTRKGDKENRLMADALVYWDEKVDEGSRPPPPEVPLYGALLHMAAGEYTLRDVTRHNDPKKHLAKSLAEFTQARELLRQAPQKDTGKTPTAAGERNVLLAELAVAMLALGGTDEQVKAETRYKWVPEATPGVKHQRIKETGSTVHQELGRTLDLLRTADFDFKAAVARRLARELTQRGHAHLAAENLHTMLFEPPEQPEARAIIALEIYRRDPGSDLPRNIAVDLRQTASSRHLNPYPASATTLWTVLGEKVVGAVGVPPDGGPPSDNSCLAYTGVHLLQGRPDEAVRLALRGGRPETRLRALALCAEWLDDPTPAVDAAVSQVAGQAKKKDTALPSAPVLRLAQRAAEAGKADQAKAVADALADDGLKAWARAEVVAARLRVNSSSKDLADESAAELPDDPRQLRVGHAWARLAVARQNGRVTGSRDGKSVAGWPAAIHPFGLAGIALGLQDREAPGP
jgi:hypothetical protein